MTRTGLVCIFLTFDKLLGLLLSDFTKFCPRLSVELDPLRQGVGDWLFLCLYQSDMVVHLCRPSQEPVL